MEYHRYEYQALDGPRKFRLLRMFADSDEAHIRAELVTTPLEQAGCYTALSYVWGDEKPLYDAYVNNQALSVRGNLLGALRKCRKQGVMTIWADALCINQKDPQERADQVMLMPEIYKTAHEVFYYLGELRSDESRQLTILFESLFRFASLPRGERGRPAEKDLDWADLPRYGLPAVEDPKWKTLIHFMEHPWFSRIWVVQESAIATGGRFSYGDEWIDQQKLLFTIHTLSEYPSFANRIDRTPRANFSPVTQAILRCYLISMLQGGYIVIGYMGATLRRLPLSVLLSQSSVSHASDPRDLVFALLGISQEAEEPALRPNYTESVEEVYLRVAKYMVENENGVILLQHAYGQKTRNTLPSWVPRWDDQAGLQPLPARADGMRTSAIFSATGRSQEVLSLSKNGRIVVARGIILDTIQQVGSCEYIPTADDKIKPKPFDGFTRPMACLAEMLRMMGNTKQYPTGETNLEILCRLSVCDRWKGDARAPKELLEGLKMWVTTEMAKCHHQKQQMRQILGPGYGRNISLVAKNIPKGYLPSKDPQMQCYPFEFRHHSLGQFSRAIRCRSMRGYMCQVPIGSEIGDKVVLIQGSEVPYVLRPSHDGTYHVMGNCYVHGIMYGEAWDESMVEDIQIS
jgi:hypothetical protein